MYGSIYCVIQPFDWLVLFACIGLEAFKYAFGYKALNKRAALELINSNQIEFIARTLLF